MGWINDFNVRFLSSWYRVSLKWARENDIERTENVKNDGFPSRTRYRQNGANENFPRIKFHGQSREIMNVIGWILHVHDTTVSYSVRAVRFGNRWGGWLFDASKKKEENRTKEKKDQKDEEIKRTFVNVLMSYCRLRLQSIPLMESAIPC